MKTCPQCSLRYPDETTFCFIDGATLESAGSGPVGRTLGGLYLVERLIAKGPWSSTYRGRLRLVEGECAIKLPAEPMNPAQAEAFVAAVKRARRYDHPHVAAPWSGGVSSDGMAFAVRGVFDAEPLTTLLGRGPMPANQAVPIAVQVLRGLCRIHDFGGAHGDLRPSNVLVARDGRVRLVDAGYGRSLYRELWDLQADVADTLCFLAPELTAGGAQRADLDPAGNSASASADLYAVGALVARMLAGRPHLEAANAEELFTKLREPTTTPVSAALDGIAEPLASWMDELLDRACASRPANAHQVLQELEQIASDAAIALPPLAQSSGPEALEEATALASLFERWERYAVVFKKMLDLGFPAGATGQAKLSFDLIGGKLQDLRALGQRAKEHHGALAAVFGRSREGRQSIAEQMAEHVEKLRAAAAESRPIEREVGRHQAALVAFPPRFAERHRELVRWEGRSGLRQPYQELAQAYRELADLVDEWWNVSAEQTNGATRLQEQEAGVARVRAELAELRTALRIHESNGDAEIDAYEKTLAEATTELDALEPDLLDQATRFTAPLRAKPELGSCFRELQEVGR